MPGFTQPIALLALVVIPLLIYWYYQALQKKKRAALKFSKVSFIKSALGNTKLNRKRHIAFALTLAAILFLIVALADPHIPLKQTKEGVNIVLVLDVSGSMLAQDYQPNRLEAAKTSAQILLESLNPKDHAGIVLFESGATTASYLSPNKDRVIEKLQAVRPKEGRTAIGDGLALGIDMAISIPNKKKVVVLLSDGVNNAGVISPAESIDFALSQKIQVYTIGLGSVEPVVLGRDFFGNPQYAELDEATLRSIAERTGGRYFKSVDKQTLDDIYTTISDDIEREKEETSIKNWFIIAAFLTLAYQLYLRLGKKRILQ